jgi:hypothetical protein
MGLPRGSRASIAVVLTVAAGLAVALAQEPGQSRETGEVEAQMRAAKQQLDRFSAQEQQVRNREGEIFQAAQTEEARWSELVTRLEQLLKK